MSNNKSNGCSLSFTGSTPTGFFHFRSILSATEARMSETRCLFPDFYIHKLTYLLSRVTTCPLKHYIGCEIFLRISRCSRCVGTLIRVLCVSVCLCVRALIVKRLQLSTPNLTVHAVVGHALMPRSVGQRSSSRGHCVSAGQFRFSSCKQS